MLKNLYYPDAQHYNLEALRKSALAAVSEGVPAVIHHHSSSRPCEGELHEHYDAEPTEVVSR